MKYTVFKEAVAMKIADRPQSNMGIKVLIFHKC